MGTSDTAPIVAAAHWMLDTNANMAEVAFSVADDYQRRGIGDTISACWCAWPASAASAAFSATVIAAERGHAPHL